MTELKDIAFRLLKDELLDVNEQDILNLIDNLKAINNNKKEELYNHHNAHDILDQWLPGRQAVKEILSKQVCVHDLKYCIEDFRTFARSREWGIKNNLDAKFIGHIKIMAQSNKIKLREPINL